MTFYQDDDNKLWENNTGEREFATEQFAEVLVDLQAVLDFGGQKHGYGSWKNPDNPSLQHKANYVSIYRHLAKAMVNKGSVDPDTGVDHRLHAISRLCMSYIRDKRGVGVDVETADDIRFFDRIVSTVLRRNSGSESK